MNTEELITLHEQYSEPCCYEGSISCHGKQFCNMRCVRKFESESKLSTSMLAPKIHPIVSGYCSPKRLQNVMEGKSPTHIVFPQVLVEKLKNFKQHKYKDVVKIHLAHKCTESSSLLKAAAACGIGVDVSTAGELKSALKAGFRNVSCSGPKNEEFLKNAIEAGATISVDSIEELQSICAVSVRCNILIRLNNPKCRGRNITLRKSRFGVDVGDLDACYTVLEANEHVTLIGFHFHASGYPIDARISIIEYMMELIQDAHRRGFSPDSIDIGGGFRPNQLKDSSGWERFVVELEKELKEGNLRSMWGNYAYGLQIDNDGKLIGRDAATSKNGSDDLLSIVDEVCESPFQGGTLGKVLKEAGIRIILEPGYLLVHDCGFTAFSVVGTKKVQGDNFVVVDGHVFSIAGNMFDIVGDPLLLSKQESNQQWKGFIAGSLCREDDFLSQRRISWSKEPEKDDVVVVCNTAAYCMNYEACNPQMHNTPKRLVAVQTGPIGWKTEVDE